MIVPSNACMAKSRFGSAEPVAKAAAATAAAVAAATAAATTASASADASKNDTTTPAIATARQSSKQNKQRRVGFLLEEDRSKLMNVFKQLEDPVINKDDAGEYHKEPKTVATTATAMIPQSAVKNKQLFAVAAATAASAEQAGTATRISKRILKRISASDDNNDNSMNLINKSPQCAYSKTGTDSMGVGRMMATDLSTTSASNSKRISSMTVDLTTNFPQFASSETGTNSTGVGQIMATDQSTASAPVIAATAIRISKRISSPSSSTQFASYKTSTNSTGEGQMMMTTATTTPPTTPPPPSLTRNTRLNDNQLVSLTSRLPLTITTALRPTAPSL